MKSYELRFLNAGGGSVFVYHENFPSDDAAWLKALALKEIVCERVEIWRDEVKIHDGAKNRLEYAGCVRNAERFQALAAKAETETQRHEYLAAAQSWADLASYKR